MQFFAIFFILIFCFIERCESYVLLGYTAGQGISYNKGYASIGLFEPLQVPLKNKPFYDLQAHWFEKDLYAFNLGMGLRRSLAPVNGVLGVNVYYDYLNFHEHSFNQIGIGFEYYSCNWDFRINGYLPIGKLEHKIRTCLFDRYEGGFIIENKQFRDAMRGFDAEIGYHVPLCCPYNLYAAIGGYYYSGNSCRGHQEGGTVRLLSWLTNSLNVEVNLLHDTVEKRRASITLTYVLPVWPSQRSNKCCFQPVVRNNIINTENRCDWEWNFRDCIDSCSCGCGCKRIK